MTSRKEYQQLKRLVRSWLKVNGYKVRDIAFRNPDSCGVFKIPILSITNPSLDIERVKAIASILYDQAIVKYDSFALKFWHNQ